MSDDDYSEYSEEEYLQESFNQKKSAKCCCVSEELLFVMDFFRMLARYSKNITDALA